VSGGHGAAFAAPRGKSQILTPQQLTKMQLAGTVGALGGSAPARSGGIHLSEFHMKQTSRTDVEEPVGIVISGGPVSEAAPRFSAYMWAPGPEDDVIDTVQAA
jgi:hypothetical protein